MAQWLARHLIVPLVFAALVTPAIPLAWIADQTESRAVTMAFCGYQMAITDLLLAWLVFGRSLGLLRFPAVLLLLVGVAWALSLQFPPSLPEWLAFLCLHAAMLLVPLYQLRFQGLRLSRLGESLDQAAGLRQYSLSALLGLSASAALVFLAARWMSLPRDQFREVLVYTFGFAWVGGLNLWSGWHPRAARKCGLAAFATSLLLGIGMLWLGAEVGRDDLLWGALLSGFHSALILAACAVQRSLGWELRGWPGDNSAPAGGQAPPTTTDSDKNLSDMA
jgi:hypothetical protein